MHERLDDGSEDSEDVEENDWVADAMGGETGSIANNVHYTKENERHQSLEAPILRTHFLASRLSCHVIYIFPQGLFYINQYGQEIYPTPNPAFLRNLNSKSVLIYACGSLFTRWARLTCPC